MASGDVNWPIPMRAIGAQNLLTMPGGVTISGYLHKRGGKQLQLFKWPLRFVIIHKGCVYYFKTSTSAASQGAFSLNGYNSSIVDLGVSMGTDYKQTLCSLILQSRVISYLTNLQIAEFDYTKVMRAAEETTSNNVFPFKMVHISKKHRTWYFSAASEEERKKWMLALRKEIDYYHEKKETITDLSDSGSDSDSFYGSVERPVDIKYTHNSADDSWQDEDDDEEDYEQPDLMDDSAPSYPPPPIPVVQENEVTSSKLSPRISAPPKPPSPPARTYPRKSSDSYIVQEASGKPPVPPFPPAHRPNDSINRSTDRAEKDLKKDYPTFSYIPGRKPTLLPPQPPPVHRVEPLPSQPRKDLISSHSKDGPFGNKPPCRVGTNSLQEELASRLNNTVPPVTNPTSRSNHVMTPVLPIKPAIFPSRPVISPMNSYAPPIPTKPRALSESSKSPEEFLTTAPKPILAKPTPIPPQLKPRKIEGGFSPHLRSPPDGQSFRDITMELPIRPERPWRSKDDKCDSDDDYEKVPLPASVYVDTCDSLDVERMFKATDARGSPLNGLFCIRNSAKSGKVLVVWDELETKLRNYRIFEKDLNVYLEAEKLFPDLSALVEHYYGNTLPSHDRLVLKFAYGCPNNPR